MEKNNKIINILFSTLVIFFVFAIVFFGVAIANKIKEGKFIGKDIEIRNTISISGYGEVFAKPDVAILTLSIVNENINIQKALSENASKSNKVLEFLWKNEIEEKDIKTTSFNIYPRYEYLTDSSKRVLAGYEVRQSLEVKIRDLENIGPIITGAVNAGAGNISGPDFIIDDENALKEEARRMAINSAKEKAQKIAGQLNVGLSKIVSFNEATNIPILRMEGSFSKELESYDSEEMSSPNIQTGENIIRVDVSLTYEIN